MNDIHSTLRFPILAALLLALAGCNGTTGFGGSGSGPSAATPNPPPTDMAGRWLLASPGRGQCSMVFGATPGAIEGTIAPAGGCPGKFFTSRKWTYEQGGLVMRDHNGQPLAQLAGAGGRFEGKSTAGEPITLSR
ncbi:MAG: AprI/Inh family metalloprotease inhibitor [Rhizobiales bacterium]|jgi:hypothetical protein|nr:AprI/Inh family metalloprotease inhibitor [Hyphomicrobiales bacterium]